MTTAAKLAYAKAKGREWENEIVSYLHFWGVSGAERRRLNGVLDRGDIAGIPGLVIEAKNAKKIELAGWLAEAEVERENANARWGVVWVKRRGKPSAGDGYVVMDGRTFMDLMFDAGHAGR